MNGDTFEEDGLAVQQYLLAASLYGAETHLILQHLTVQRHLYVVELWILRTPQL